MQRYTIDSLLAEFPDDDACLAWLVQQRWPHGIPCETCGKVTAHHPMRTRRSYSCDYCGHHVHPTAGTILHKSSTPLHKWFYAIFLMSQTRCGISAKQLEREVGVTYKTAWRMFRQIRSMLAEDIDDLTGNVEADETYVGGHRRGTPRGRPSPDSHKVPVFGMVERQGRVVAKIVPDVRKVTLMPHVTQRIMPASQVFTDELKSYNGLHKAGYHQSRVNHSAGVYVSGDAHTNTIEGFWSLAKRGIGGVYHAVGANYLQFYLDEYSFRYNHRKDESPMFKTMLGLVALRAE